MKTRGVCVGREERRENRIWPQLDGRRRVTNTGLIDQTGGVVGLVCVQILGTTRAKLFLSGWKSFLWSQVIQSAAADVIVLVRRRERESEKGRERERGLLDVSRWRGGEGGGAPIVRWGRGGGGGEEGGVGTLC